MDVQWSASRPGRFNTGERVPGTHWIEDWVEPRTGLDAKAKRKKITSLPPPRIETRSSSP